MSRASRSLIVLFASCAVAWLGSGRLLAQRPGRIFSEPAYRELLQLSRSLNEGARRASEKAQRRDSWISRRDRNLLDSIAEFARNAGRFDERLANYRASPWQVDDDLRGLLRSAQEVQDRIRNSRFGDGRTLSDWNEVVETLNRMVKVSQSSAGVTDFVPAEPRRDEYGEARRPPGPRDSGELGGLARELEDRAGRAFGLAQRVAAQGPYRREFFQSIREFHDQTVAFRRQVESGASDRSQIRAEAGRLLVSARETDQRLRRGNAFREVWPDWQGAMQVRQRVLKLVGG